MESDAASNVFLSFGTAGPVQKPVVDFSQGEPAA
jgi:hypothetical protein